MGEVTRIKYMERGEKTDQDKSPAGTPALKSKLNQKECMRIKRTKEIVPACQVISVISDSSQSYGL